MVWFFGETHPSEIDSPCISTQRETPGFQGVQTVHVPLYGIRRLADRAGQREDWQVQRHDDEPDDGPQEHDHERF